MFLPSLALAIGMIGVYTRVLRSDVATTLQEDFVLTARSRGLSPRSILLRHTLRPSSLSLVSLVGLQSGFLLGGSLLVEQLFAFPYGIGSILVPAAITVDIPVVLSTATVIGVTFTIVMILFDLLLRVIDPRISRG
jgi:peptide/nickel transport system permease protein